MGVRVSRRLRHEALDLERVREEDRIARLER